MKNLHRDILEEFVERQAPFDWEGLAIIDTEKRKAWHRDNPRTAYKKAWKAANPEKVKAQKARWKARRIARASLVPDANP